MNEIVLGDIETCFVDSGESLSFDRDERVECHLAEEFDYFYSRETEAGTRVDVGSSGDEGSRSERRSVDRSRTFW